MGQPQLGSACVSRATPVRLGLSASRRDQLPRQSLRKLCGSGLSPLKSLSPPAAVSLGFAAMNKAEKLFDKLIAARSDANFAFDDLCTLLTKLGYAMRKAKGSHIIFQRGSSFLNLQPSAGGKAKAYQVRQTREELQKMNLKP